MANHPDEPAHFVTGLMVHDYLADAPGSDPLSFARAYYAHYPKVAFGHWPPMYYVIQAAWYGIAGPTKLGALLLGGSIAAAMASSLYLRLKPTCGVGLAAAQALVFLALPLVRTYSSVVMSDLLVGLFTLLAVWSLADLLRERRPRHAIGFLLWSGLGLMTKGNAAALVFLPFLALPMTGSYGLLTSWKSWGFVLLLVLASAGLFGFVMVNDTQQASHFLARIFWLPERPWMRLIALPNLWDSVGPLIASAALLGAADSVRHRAAASDAPGWVLDSRVALAWIGSVLVFLVISPVGSEGRYVLPALPAVLLLGARGLCVVGDWAGRWWPAGRRFLPIPLALGMLAAVPGRPPDRIYGYEAVARSIPLGDGGEVVLVSSNTIGEGAFVVERRLMDPRRKGTVLRASKALARSSWFGSDYTPLFGSTDELRRFLIRRPVHFIVLDDFKPRGQEVEPHHDLLRRLVAAEPQNFARLRSVTMSQGDRRHEGAVQVYENLQARGIAPAALRVGLGRIDEQRPEADLPKP